MAGLIEGPCEVLPPSKFTEERERRTRAVTEKNDLRPLYLCKYVLLCLLCIAFVAEFHI